MAMNEERCGTAMSNGSRMSDTRRAKLMDLKRREDLKDALIEKFKGRFGPGSQLKDADEMSVSSAVIRKELDHARRESVGRRFLTRHLHTLGAMGGSASTAIGPESWTGTVLPFLIDAARQGAKKVVLDGKTFAPFGMVPHAVEPEKVAAYRPKASAGRPPAKVDLRQYMTHVEDQSQTNSCCANAEYINKRYAMAKGDRTEDISRLFIYYVGRKRDQQLFREERAFGACPTSLAAPSIAGHGPRVAPKDEGMSLGGAISALELKGACMEKNWPFNIDRVNHKPNDPCFTEAVRYKIAESKKVPVDLSSMRRCLAEGLRTGLCLPGSRRWHRASERLDGIVSVELEALWRLNSRNPT
eukprot:g2960.t1